MLQEDEKKNENINEDDIEIFKMDFGESLSEDKLFGEKFVEVNKGLCKIIINEKEYGLSSYIEEINKEKRIEIKLKGISKIKDISYMFSGCSSLSSLPDISKWNTNNVNNMSGMFSGCSSLSSLPDISNWNTNNVKNMSIMFNGCSSLSSLPFISKWNTNNVNNMSEMFSRSHATRM